MNRQLRTPLLCFLLAVGLAALALSGCAAKAAPKTEEPPKWSMTPETAADYFYLVYYDALREGDAETADEALRQILDLAPSPLVYLELADLKLRQGDVAASREALKSGLTAFPDDPKLTARLADTYLAERRYDDAATTLSLYLERHPDSLEMRLKLADILIEARKYAEALDALAVIPAEARTPEVLFIEARASARLGMGERAIRLLEKVVAAEPGNVMAWAELAYQEELAKDYLAAEKSYNRIIELGEASDEVWFRLIRLSLELNDPDKALSLVRRGPEDPLFEMEAARIFIDQDFFEQARAILVPLSESPAPPPELYFYLALLSFEGDKDPEAALNWLDKLPEDKRLAAQAMNFRAHLLYVLKRYEPALKLVDEGKTRYPKSKDFWEIESWILEETGQTGKALEAMGKALEKWPDDPRLVYRLGILQEKAGDMDAAIATMERAIGLDPRYADALNFLGYVLAEQNRDLDRAEILVKTALEEKPESGYIVDSLAWVYFRQGKLKKAWATINQAVALEPGDPTIWEHYGDIAAAQGNTAEAARGYKKALALETPNAERIRQKLEKP